MGTLSTFLKNARYDLIDYGTGLEFDDAELIVYLNRMIGVMDSTLASLRSEFVHATETELDFTASIDYLDITNLNNGYWDSIRSIWFDSDIELEKIPLDVMYYKRKWYSGDADPYYWCIEGQHVLFETTVNADTDVIIHYNKKHRPLLESYSQTVTANASTDRLTPASAHSFITGDGPFQISNSGGALPTGLSASTNYWIIYEADIGSASFQVATSKTNAIKGTAVDITATGSGTHTWAFTNSTDMMPYNGKFDEMLREMLVMHAKAKKEGQIGSPEQIYQEVFRKRMMEETIRRGFVPNTYSIDF
jgi:hypothetical protein